MFQQHPHRWATAGEFDERRSTITRLYIEENRGLKDVMNRMEQEHGFYATPKMYKYRLKRWDLHKYQMKANDTRGLGEPGESSSALQIRRHPRVGATGLNKSKGIKAEPVFVSSVKTRGTRGGSTAVKQAHMPIHRQLSSPEVLRLPEEVMQLSWQLGYGLVDLGFWTGKSDLPVKPQSYNWWGRAVTASQLFDLKKYKQAFDTLNSTFEEFGTLLENPDPGLLQVAYLIVLQLDELLSRRFLVFAAEMAAIRLPVRHPLRILLSRLRDTGVMQLRVHALCILESYLSALETQLGPSNSSIMLLYENLYDTLDFLSHERNLQFVDSVVIESRQQNQIQTLELLGLFSAAQSARLALAFTYWRHGLVEEAEKTNNVILDWLQTHPRDQHSKNLDLWDSLYLRFRCKEKVGTVADVERASREYIGILRQEVGSENKRTIAAVGHLQKYYKERGYTKEAEGLEPDINDPSETLTSY